MDVFAHTLWTNALFHLKYHRQRKMRYVAAFFGVAPDLVGFTPVFVYLILSGRAFSEPFPFADRTNWTFFFAEEAYKYTHSLVVFAICFAAIAIIGSLYFWSKRGKFNWWVFWPMLGWALHILIDIPTHPDFYHTPFLFPISSYQNTHGVSWGHPIFMVINYSLLTVSYIALTYYHRQKHGRHK